MEFRDPPHEQQLPTPADAVTRQQRLERLSALLSAQGYGEVATLLQDNHPAGFQRLARIILGEQERRKSLTGLLVASIGLYLFLFLLLICLTELSALPLVAWNLTAGIGLTAFAVQNSKPTRLERAALEFFYCVEDETYIGPLLETWRSHPAALRDGTKLYLVRLLPQLTASTFQRLSFYQQQILYRFLEDDPHHPNQALRLATIAALRRAGDWNSLGRLYLLMTEPAIDSTAAAVRQEASIALIHLLKTLDFGPPSEALPRFIAMAFDTSEPHTYFTAILAIRCLLPQLTPENYRTVLFEHQRRQLYDLIYKPLWVFRFEGGEAGKREMQSEIIRTAERLEDTCAVEALRYYLNSILPVRDELNDLVDAVARQALQTLLEKETQKSTLLRAASAPAIASQELLRAARSGTPTYAANEMLRAAPAQQADITQERG